MEIKPYLRRPQFYETDGMSIIWHGNYVRWMEESRTDFMDQLGFPYARAVEAGIDFALTDISCKYRAMTRFGEELAITVFIRRLSPAKLELGYEMREASTGELKAEGTFTRAATSYSTSRYFTARSTQLAPSGTFSHGPYTSPVSGL